MKPNIDRNKIEIINMISLVVIAISTASIALKFDDIIDLLAVIGNK